MQFLILMLFQIVCAVLGARLLLFTVLPQLPRLQYPSLVTDIWVPIAIVMPMLVMVGHLDGDVGGIGWVPVAGPMLCAPLALGLALLVGRDADLALGAPVPRTLLIWLAVGLMYLLLSIAHNLAVWTGQILFASGAVLLWFNTPDYATSPRVENEAEARASFGMLLVLVLGLGQGAAAYLAGPDHAGTTGALMVGYVVLVLAGATRVAGVAVGVRLGGWSATYGVLFSLGLASLLFMLPSILGFFLGMQPSISLHVAHGFGHYAFEAMGMMILGPALLLLSRMSHRLRRLCGGIVILVVAILAALRLAMI